jgi:hypothetical protein
VDETRHLAATRVSKTSGTIGQLSQLAPMLAEIPDGIKAKENTDAKEDHKQDFGTIGPPDPISHEVVESEHLDEFTANIVNRLLEVPAEENRAYDCDGKKKNWQVERVLAPGPPSFQP